MRVAILTREYPPEVYGGAGVHVQHLAEHLRDRVELTVHCMGEPRAGARAHQPWPALADANPVLSVLSADLSIAAALAGFDVLHSHTWYTALAGRLGQLLHGVPHVLTAHSLEPLRPWKGEQLGGGYAVSGWCERSAIETADAVIAVSRAMGEDIRRYYPEVDPARIVVVHNGIDAGLFTPAPDEKVPPRYGMDPARPYLIFVGRITRQKGVLELLDAAAALPADAQLLLCASAPDTPELGAEVARRVAALRETHPGVRQVSDAVPRADLVALLSGARALLCPSVYEPLGIVNLEAMACGAAVVASEVGGIPEVVRAGETGLLIPMDRGPQGDPVAGPGWQHRFADAMLRLLDDPQLAAALGAAGRRRAVTEFSWERAAERTVEIYRQVSR